MKSVRKRLEKWYKKMRKRTDGTLNPLPLSHFADKHFPTDFACSIADAVSITDCVYMLENAKYWELCKSEDEVDHSVVLEFEKAYNALRNFQKLAVACSFEKCLVAFHGFDLTPEQVTGLEVIHEATGTFMLGHTVDRAIERMDNNKTSNKDFGTILHVVLEALKAMDGVEGGQSMDPKAIKSLTLKIENMEQTV